MHRKRKTGLRYASEKGITVMEAFMYRLHPQWQHVRQIIRQRRSVASNS